jgi:hypothetical protein
MISPLISSLLVSKSTPMVLRTDFENFPVAYRRIRLVLPEFFAPATTTLNFIKRNQNILSVKY